jgi:hypothetical protein
MLKKVILTILLSALIGVLIWGGINRTLAKTNDNNGRTTTNQNLTSDEFVEGNAAQQRGKADRESPSGEDCDQSNHQPDANAQIEEDIKYETDQRTRNFANADWKESGDQNEHDQTAYRNGQSGGSDPLTDSEVEALYLALDDEYHTLAVYQSVIDSFGEVDPFVDIALSEQRHIDALIKQFNKHELDVPDNSWIGNVSKFDSITQACQVGVEAEIGNAELYNQLFRMTDDISLTRVFTNLRNASLKSHLPQFEACQ